MGVIESRIWVYAEHHQGRPSEVSLELIQKALQLGRQIGWKVAAVLVGSELAGPADEILSYEVDEVLCLEDPLLEQYCNQAYTKALTQAIGENEVEVFLLGATSLGLDLGARLAARLRTGLSAHCVDLEIDAQGGLMTVVPGWDDGSMARISCPAARPQMATIKPGVFELPQPGQSIGRIIRSEVSIAPEDCGYRVVGLESKEIQPSGLDTAEIVVAGGWGIGDKEDWKLIQDLAAVLGGAVGATRPPVDEGWAEEDQMIGTSGRTVKPKLYIGVALSGHMHHMVGLKNPGLTVGINQDPAAPIFSQCD
ncbi:MAG: electron transfer flavoprotein subunit alpha/FixB family protein, partial [Deltaproteobacteria bacterium]|nr:electron transfer flavoprotein subunit alpha/FixB family protein [Deltaproteobacteria bacterium]